MQWVWVSSMHVHTRAYAESLDLLPTPDGRCSHILESQFIAFIAGGKKNKKAKHLVAFQHKKDKRALPE